MRPLGPERLKAPEGYQINMGEFFVLREQGLAAGDVNLGAVNQYLSKDFVRELLQKVEISKESKFSSLDRLTLLQLFVLKTLLSLRFSDLRVRNICS